MPIRAELTPPNVLDAPVADGLTLAGFDSAAAAWEPAARLRLDLYWQRIRASRHGRLSGSSWPCARGDADPVV
ncbi:MAG: hypothetical protein R2838_04730 [Caldilineaceae bacterium]